MNKHWSGLKTFIVLFILFLLFAFAYIAPRITTGEPEFIEGSVETKGVAHGAMGSSVYYVARVEDGRRFRIYPFGSTGLKTGDRVLLEVRERIIFSDMASFIKVVE